MNNDLEYIKKLENIILERYIPVYDEYYRITGKTKPNDNIVPKLKHKVPALLRSRNTWNE